MVIHIKVVKQIQKDFVQQLLDKDFIFGMYSNTRVFIIRNAVTVEVDTNLTLKGNSNTSYIAIANENVEHLLIEDSDA